jgi:hypothetical protein
MSSVGAAPCAAVPLSPARAAASRINGAKSRGPKTPEGKARSAQNALKHGLRAQKHLVLPGERATEFAALEAALLEELAPEGALQTVLARRVVAAAWRLERAERLEADLFTWNQLGGAGRNLGLALIRECNGARAFDTLLRYRGGTLAELWRALRTLKALQTEATAPQAEVGTSAPQVDATAPETPIEAEARTSPGEIAPPRAASKPAPAPAAPVPAAIPCHRASARGRRPGEPESRENPGDSDRPSGRVAPQRGEARPAEPALSLPIELAQGGSAAALLAGTALVPVARRRWP